MKRHTCIIVYAVEDDKVCHLRYDLHHGP